MESGDISQSPAAKSFPRVFNFKHISCSHSEPEAFALSLRRPQEAEQGLGGGGWGGQGKCDFKAARKV